MPLSDVSGYTKSQKGKSSFSSVFLRINIIKNIDLTNTFLEVIRILATVALMKNEQICPYNHKTIHNENITHAVPDVKKKFSQFNR